MTKNEQKAKNPRKIVLIVLLCLLAAALIGAGAGFAARRASRGPVVYRYDGLRVREGVARCLFAYYRCAIPAVYDEAVDTPAYWSAADESGRTNGERWGEAALRGVCETVAGARLYDARASFPSDERLRLRADLDDLYARLGGTDAYDDLAAPLGFDHRDLEDAVLLLRKAALLPDVLWGADGGSISDADLNAFLAADYRSFVLIRVRIADKVKRDENGLYVPEGTSYATEPRTDEEQAEQRAAVAALKEQLGLTAADPADAAGVDIDGLWAAYNEDPAFAGTRGVCYFSDGSAYTRAFAAVYPALTEAALSLSEGQVTAVGEADAVWFVFRVGVTPDVWRNSAYADCFGDLRPRARAWLANDLLVREGARVTRVGSAGPDAGDFAALPVDTSLFPRR